MSIPKKPRLVGALIGLVTGIPQGINLPEMPIANTSDLSDAAPLVIGFGLLAPPLLVFLGLSIQKGRSHVVWDKVNQYLDLYHYMVWGCLSLAVSGVAALHAASALDPDALTVCAYFAAGGIGFAVASLVDRKARKKYAA